MLNASTQFRQHSKVADGCSELLVELRGDSGRHARSIMGVSSLPRRMVVEMDAVLALNLAAT